MTSPHDWVFMNERNPVKPGSERPAVGTGGEDGRRRRPRQQPGQQWDPRVPGTPGEAGREAGLNPEDTFCKHVCGSFIQQSPEDQARAEREHAAPVGRGADGAVGARAEQAPARALGGGGDPAQAAAPHAQEPWLRGQLPREARVPEGGVAEAEVGAGARGGQAGARERRHALGARRAARQVRGPAGLRALSGRRPRPCGARGTGQRHHHRQVRPEPRARPRLRPGPRPRPRPRRLLLVPAEPRPLRPRPFSKPRPSVPSCLP